MKYDKVVRAGINGCGNIIVEQILNYLFDQTNNKLDRSQAGFHRPASASDKVIHTFRYLDHLEPGNKCHLPGLEGFSISLGESNEKAWNSTYRSYDHQNIQRPIC
jgi:metal-dependent hydrolase (beta-lactamase superfamily II)